MKNKQTLWIIIVSILAAVLIAAVLYIVTQRQQMQEFVEQAELVKEELNDEYNALTIQYEGYKMNINNDSLIAQLETEQLKVQRLQEELKTVKATNTREISKLKKELETLRGIMRGYVVQIDSLDRLNKQLEEKNKRVTAQYQQASRTVSQLTQEKEQLRETVTMASKLDASNVAVRGITDKNKTTDKIKRMAQIEVSFTINKNITAEPGEKDIFIRIQKPDDDILVKSHSNTFAYENKQIPYSAKRTIEYTGEEQAVSIYWPIEELLVPGTYRVDIFADGNLIGKKSFELEK